MRKHYAFLAAAIMLTITASTFAFDSYNVGNNPTHLAAGDINGDGWIDLVQANSLGGAQDVSILYADPALPGKFIIGTVLHLDLGAVIPNTIALGDFNKDGRLDIVAGDNSAAATNVRLLLQSAVGTFPTNTAVPIGANSFQPQYVLAVDVNGDGNLDIVSANVDSGGSGAPSVSVITGNGNGTFNAATELSVGVGVPDWVAAGDFNGDGKPDLMTVNGATNRLVMLLSQANGTFSSPISIAIPAGGRFISTADFNNDGKVDVGLLLSPSPDNNSVNILTGIGDGTFQLASSNPVFPYNGPGGFPDITNPNFAVSDVTGDGNADILFVTDIGTGVPSNFGLTGNGNGTFATATDFQFQVPGIGRFSVIADFNKDGQQDIATALINPGTNGITVELLNPRAIVTSVAPTGLLQNGSLPGNTLTVNGTGFLMGAKIQIDGIDLVTSGTATQLTGNTTNFVFNTPGLRRITVVNPAPGGFASDPAFLSVYPTTLGTYVVTNTNDDGAGSLRFALANARNGDQVLFDATVFDLVNSDAATLINVLSELPALDDGSVTIDASDRRVTVNGSGAASAAGLNITSSGNTVRGLSIIGFTKSGIAISSGAKNNVIGGSRATGTGANKQGLRISGNGAFGIEITGAGTDSNTVKGCWIGLEASGTEPSPNLAGVLIQGGAKTNTIGSTDLNEANVISGNSFEAVTVSGDGTDDNVIIGNLVGVAAVQTVTTTQSGLTARGFEDLDSRVSVGNGSTGIFLSKGTQGSRVGGDSDNETNVIAFNGGNGVEVRAVNSRKNTSKRNRITKNVRGGIALFDGSNDNIQAPTITNVELLDTRPTSSTAGRAVVRARVNGTVNGDGIVEIFLDDGSQGGTFATRVSAGSGKFTAEIDVDERSNITATYTDTNGNTSPFGVFGALGGSDTDGDGISDLLETLAGTNPNSSSDVPLDGGTVSVDKASVKIGFAKTGKDAVSATLRLVLPEEYDAMGSSISVVFAGLSETFTLDAKGGAAANNASLRVKGSAGDTGLLSFAVKNRDLRTLFAAVGFTDRTTAKEGEKVSVSAAVAIVSGGTRTVYTGKTKLLYKAVLAKAGKAAKSK